MVAKSASCKLENLKSAFKTGLTRKIADRIKVLRALQACLNRREEEILAALEVDLGKPRLEGFLSEVFFLNEEIDLVCKKLAKWLKPKRVGNPLYFFPAKSWIEMEPYGSVLVIAPWNYPLQLALAPLVAAVAAGNVVMLKPSEVSSEVERVLVEMIAEVFPEDWVCCVTGGVEVSEELLGMDFDFVFFTGSTAVGKLVDA